MKIENPIKMRHIAAAILGIIFFAFYFGFLLPWCMSQSDTLTNLAGIGLIAVFFFAVVVVANGTVTKLLNRSFTKEK